MSLPTLKYSFVMATLEARALTMPSHDRGLCQIAFDVSNAKRQGWFYKLLWKLTILEEKTASLFRALCHMHEGGQQRSSSRGMPFWYPDIIDKEAADALRTFSQ